MMIEVKRYRFQGAAGEYVYVGDYDNSVRCFLDAAERCVAAERREADVRKELERTKRCMEINGDSAQGKHLEGLRYRDERDALQLRLNAADQRIDELTQRQGEHVALVPVERSYDVRAQQILAFNNSKQAGGDLDDALGAAYKAALRYTPHPGG